MKWRILILVAGLSMATANGAQAQSTENYREGYAQGYKDGFDEGYRKAREEQQRTLEATSKNFPIAITVATYGPDSWGGNNSCNALSYVMSRANGRRSATIAVSNDMCGDPAPGKRKSLNVTYYCGALAKTASANEHRSVYLSCD